MSKITFKMVNLTNLKAMVAFEFVKHHTFLEAHWTRFFKHWAYNSGTCH